MLSLSTTVDSFFYSIFKNLVKRFELQCVKVDKVILFCYNNENCVFVRRVMKKRIFVSIVGMSTAFALIASGCSGKSIDQIDQISNDDETSDVPQTSEVVEMQSKTDEEAVVTDYTDVTEISKLTSCATHTTIEANESVIDEIISEMTLDEKIYQMFIVTPEALTNFNGSVTQAGDLTKSAIEASPVGGIIYFSQNIESWQQTYDMIHDSQEYAQKSNNNIGMFFAVDEEGGIVARVGNGLRMYDCYDMEYYGDTLDYDTVYSLGNTIGATISKLGFNLDLAPVADVNLSPDNELGSRIFSSNPQVVADMSANFVRGVEGCGVSATLKHFPGLGAGTGNTHNGSVVIDRTYDELLYNEFTAFSGGIQAGADFVMVGHQITTASGDDLPGDLSPVVVNQWLKNDLGFSGLVITDSQSMGAITENYTPGDAAVMSIEAGVDIILMPYDLNNAVTSVRSAVDSGKISEARINESVYKILSKKFNLGLIKAETPQTTTTITK